STAEWFTQSARLCCRDVRHVRAISPEICAEICDAVRLTAPNIPAAASIAIPRRNESEDHDRFSTSALCHAVFRAIALIVPAKGLRFREGWCRDLPEKLSISPR